MVEGEELSSHAGLIAEEVALLGTRQPALSL